MCNITAVIQNVQELYTSTVESVVGYRVLYDTQLPYDCVLYDTQLPHDRVIYDRNSIAYNAI